MKANDHAQTNTNLMKMLLESGASEDAVSAVFATQGRVDVVRGLLNQLERRMRFIGVNRGCRIAPWMPQTFFFSVVWPEFDGDGLFQQRHVGL